MKGLHVSLELTFDADYYKYLSLTKRHWIEYKSIEYLSKLKKSDY